MSEENKKLEEGNCEPCYDIDYEELLKTATIIGYVEKRWDSYICLEKDGKHYVLLFSAQVNSGNNIYVELFGPNCDKAKKITTGYLAEEDYYLTEYIPEIAKECWEKNKPIESIKEVKTNNEKLLSIKYADESSEVYSSNFYEWKVNKHVEVREKTSQKLVAIKYLGSSDWLSEKNE